MIYFLTLPAVFTTAAAILAVVIPLYIIISIKILRAETDSKKRMKGALIKVAILIVLMFVSMLVFRKTVRYHIFEKHLVENEHNNIRYTLANLDAVWESRKGKYYTIREYTAGFSFAIDNVKYYQLHIVPEDFTNYTYFVKINIDNTNYSEIMLTKIKPPSNFSVPVGGWTTNPLPALSNHIMNTYE